MLQLYPLPSPLSGPIFWFRPLCKGVTYVREICYQKSAATIDFHLCRLASNNESDNTITQHVNTACRQCVVHAYRPKLLSTLTECQAAKRRRNSKSSSVNDLAQPSDNQRHLHPAIVGSPRRTHRRSPT